MTIQQQEQQSDVPPKQLNKRFHRTRWLIASIAFLLIAVGARIWILTNRSAFTTILPLVIFTILGVLISLFQWLFPLSSTLSKHVSEGPQNAPVVHQIQPFIVHVPTTQPLLEPATPPHKVSYRPIFS